MVKGPRVNPTRVVLRDILCEDKVSFQMLKAGTFFTFEKPAGQW